MKAIGKSGGWEAMSRDNFAQYTLMMRERLEGQAPSPGAIC